MRHWTDTAVSTQSRSEGSALKIVTIILHKIEFKMASSIVEQKFKQPWSYTLEGET